MRVEIYSDGACSDNGKANAIGGWAVCLRALRKVNSNKREVVSEKVFTGNKASTTNNEMELQAIIVGLQKLKPESAPEHVYHIYTDSKYVINCMEKWIFTWMKNGWKTADKKPVKNKALLEELYMLTQLYKPTFHWVKGHANHPLNNRVDELAVQAKLELMEASR